MADYLLDNFIDTVGVLLQNHTMDLGAGWTIVPGDGPSGGATWDIQANGLRCLFGGVGAAALADASSPDAVLTVFTHGFSGDSLVQFRRVDANNYWLYGGDLTTFRLTEVTAGVATVRGSFTPTIVGSGSKLTVEVLGDSIECYLNDVLKIAHTSTSHDSATLFGLDGANAGGGNRFVSFEVSEIPMPTAAREVLISDAVVAELNDPARTWNTPTAAFTAVRSWLPVYADADLAALKVSVVPPALDEEKINRTQEKLEYTIVVDLQKWINNAAGADSLTTQIDALTLIAQQIHVFFKDAHFLATQSAWKVMKATRPDIYDLERLYAQNVWETVVILIVRGYV